MEYGEQSPPEVRNDKEMSYLFSVVSDCLSKAAIAQSRNSDARFFGIRIIDNQAFYAFSLAKSYVDFLEGNREAADHMEVLIPAMGVDIDHPMVEQLVDNSDAYFMVRKFVSPGVEEYLIVRPYKIDHLKADGETDLFFEGVEPQDRIFNLAHRIDTYEMIPANVLGHRNILSSILLEDPGNAA